MAADLHVMILCDPFLCIPFVYLFVSVSPTESASVFIIVLRSRLENTARLILKSFPAAVLHQFLRNYLKKNTNFSVEK